MERRERLSAVGSVRHALSPGTGVGLVAVLFAGGCGACSSSDQFSESDAASTVDAEAGVDAGLDGGQDAPLDRVEGSSDTSLPDGPNVNGVPPGWESWAGWDVHCPLYVPGHYGQMPPPIEWEPCPAPIPSGLVCRRMKNTWSGLGAARLHFALDPGTKQPVVQFTRVGLNGDSNRSLMLVAEADGVVRSALLQLNSQNLDCGYWPDALTSTRYVIDPTMWQHMSDWGKAVERGAISGRLTPDPPDLLLRLETDTSSYPTTMSWYASDALLVGLSTGKHRAWSWNLQQQYTVYTSGQDLDGLPPYEATVVGGDVFTTVSSSGRCGVMSWNVAHGSRPLLRWYGDTTHGAGNFGTDGTDMVWTYDEGPNACSNDPPNPAAVWTAPYTTDPAVVSASSRRLRTEMRGMTVSPYAVGYGYAMHWVAYGDPPTNALFVVRLADGVSWQIPGSTNSSELSWGPVLGFTQTELFVGANMSNSSSILRIRLDSLGPGDPPD